MNTASFSFLSECQKITLTTYRECNKCSAILAEVSSRVVGIALLSLGAALDFVYHGVMIFPTLIYVVGKSVATGRCDFKLPWQHLQRMRNSVAGVVFGSACSVIHPFFGLGMAEPTDKHVVLGMLAPGQGTQLREAPCSPLHTYEIVGDVAKRNPDHFTKEHVKLIRQVRCYEHVSEILQNQEFIQKLTNITLLVLAKLLFAIEGSKLNGRVKEIAVRAIGIFVPILAVVDAAIALLLQSLFLVTGAVHLVSGRGPMYTEITWNPLTHITFMVQNVLKLVGNLIGTVLWFVKPRLGFKASLSLPLGFFKVQLFALNCFVKCQLRCLGEGEKAAFPVLFGQADKVCEVFTMPTHELHKTYLVVLKVDGKYNLSWVNRPDIQTKKGLKIGELASLLNEFMVERFPYMNPKKLFEYPVKYSHPTLSETTSHKIESQSEINNCVVSNLFGMLRAVDVLNGEMDYPGSRYQAVREDLLRNYSFYKHAFHPFSKLGNRALSDEWEYFNKLTKPI